MASTDVWRGRSRLGLALLYSLAGVLHIAIPNPFLSITPSWVPDPPHVILITGLCEITGAIGLLIPTVRRYAGMGLALYAVTVFPANLEHALDSLGGSGVSPWQWLYHLVRLPLQPVLVWLALFASEAAMWPFADRRGGRSAE